jgi:Fe-S-cluster containining protein
MDTRMERAYQDMQQNALGLDDAFTFKCRACGRCCKNRHDIILTTRDLFNISRSLGRTMQYTVERYCVTYIGDSSRVPIVLLDSVGPDQACPLLRNRRCIVHKSKPVVCALYPLGRGIVFESPDLGENLPDALKPVYFIQSSICGGKEQTHTVRGWLNMFNLPADDEFYSLWTKALKLLTESCVRLEAAKTSNSLMETVWALIFAALYQNYDIEADLIPQFRENTEKLSELIRIIIAKTESGSGDESREE